MEDAMLVVAAVVVAVSDEVSRSVDEEAGLGTGNGCWRSWWSCMSKSAVSVGDCLWEELLCRKSRGLDLGWGWDSEQVSVPLTGEMRMDQWIGRGVVLSESGRKPRMKISDMADSKVDVLPPRLMCTRVGFDQSLVSILSCQKKARAGGSRSATEAYCSC